MTNAIMTDIKQVLLANVKDTLYGLLGFHRDRLDTLTDEEFVKFMLYDLPCLKTKMTSTEQGMLEWLRSPYCWEDFRVSRHKDYSEAVARIAEKHES